MNKIFVIKVENGVLYLIVSHLKKIGIDKYHRPIMQDVIDLQIPVIEGVDETELLKQARIGGI